MAFTNDDYLPTFEELTVPEIHLTSSVLVSGAHLYGKYCDNINKEFMLCFQEESDPRKCVSEGKQVTNCAFEFYGKVKKNCHEEFTSYWKCIDNCGSSKMDFSKCRRMQAPFDNCVKEKIGVERPPLGYFTRLREHETSRPKPQLKPLELPYPEPLPTAPDVSKIPSPEGAKCYGGISL
ncbi:hypothetical protein LOTGIDRAFT_115810 [Lottia gigantea]|uniref:NADH dehydrogenase [ubiquinone] 1 alpha subcomplex subunit 8 n=1 Tax=Lottia gigantea TaxID=225164 RepID=V3ZY95_LOTGI|nr:hypothetical protein LOTGIDRAFT_115810 [Lottia gigantea]ESO96503.1 hypothetical protein LOTGIDRAFT_115810 [Lottia gigantea]